MHSYEMLPVIKELGDKENAKMNKLFFIILIFFVCLSFSCFGDDNINGKNNITEFTPQFEKRSTLYVWLDNFRMREQPDLSSQVIDMLQFADEVEYLGKVSKTKSTVTIRGKTYEAPWIEIKTKDGKTGWVYSVGLKNEFIKIYTEPGFTEKEMEIAHLYENLSPYYPNDEGNKLVAIEPLPDPALMTKALYGKEYIKNIKYIGEKKKTGAELFTFEWGAGPVYEVLDNKTVSYDGFVVDDKFLENHSFVPMSYIMDDLTGSQAYKDIKSRIENSRKWKIQNMWMKYKDDSSHYLVYALHEPYKGYVMLSILLVTPEELISHDHIREYREGDDLFRVDDMGEFDPWNVVFDFLFKIKNGYELIYHWDGAEGRNIYIVRQFRDKFILGRRIYQPVSY